MLQLALRGNRSMHCDLILLLCKLRNAHIYLQRIEMDVPCNLSHIKCEVQQKLFNLAKTEHTVINTKTK